MENISKKVSASKRDIGLMSHITLSFSKYAFQNDKETFIHSVNVETISKFIFNKTDFSLPFIDDVSRDIVNVLGIDLISRFCLLHDVGKNKIDPKILNANRKLTEDEIMIIHSHPSIGLDQIREFGLGYYENYSANDLPLIQCIDSALEIIVIGHHENYDGTGYPRKLKETQIPYIASVVHVADVISALFEKRSYKEVWNEQDVYMHIKENRGKMFSPHVTELVLRDDIWNKILKYTKSKKSKNFLSEIFGLERGGHNR